VTSDPPTYDQFVKYLPDNPHVKFFESRERGYVSVDLTRARMDVAVAQDLRLAGSKGRGVDAAGFVVENGRARAVPA
jgi:alkaline phosphatase D